MYRFGLVQCRKISGYGLRDGGYSCECKPGYTSMEKEDDALKGTF